MHYYFVNYINKAKLDGSITEQRLEYMLNEFLPDHELFTEEVKEKNIWTWTDSKIEFVRQLFSELYTILFDHKPVGFPSTSIACDNSFFFLEIFASASTKIVEKRHEVCAHFANNTIYI